MVTLSFLLQGAAGLVALLYGRKVFWLFVALVGFLAGFALANRLFPGANPTIHLVVSIGLGLLGALLARSLPRIAAAVAGFLVGGAAILGLLSHLMVLNGPAYWIAFIVTGIAGALLATLFLDLALVVLSSLAGAYTLSMLAGQWFTWDGGTITVVYLVLLAFGILFQLRVIGGSSRR